MRHLALAATLVAGAVAGTASTAVAADPLTDGLVISEYAEGSSFNKAVELYNGTGAALDISNYELRLYSNGRELVEGPSGTYTLPSGTVLADGAVWTVTNTGYALTPGGPIDATNNSAVNFNGNDALTLVDADGTVVDSLGEVGNDADFAKDVTLRRIDFTADTTPDDAWTSVLFESFPSNTSDGIGVAPGDSPPPPPPPPPLCEVPAEELTKISAVQGTTDTSPLVDTEVTIRGVVTLADSDLNGFFVQEEVDDHDTNLATSEGIYVFNGSNPNPVEGETVALRDTVGEFRQFSSSERTETSFAFPDIDVCDVPLVTIAPTPLTLPLDENEREAFEGMLVTNAQDLQVTGLFSAYSFGELGLALDGPLLQPTSVFAPGSPEADALAADNAARELFVNDRDEAFSSFNDFPWELFDEELSAGDTMPAGRVVGALKYSFGDFKIEPLDNEVGEPNDRIFFPETDDTFERPDAPALADGNDVAAFNVLNYFNTFGDSAELRGAENAEDFAVQSAKIVDAIIRLDAKVLGLVEIENDYEDFYDDDDTTVPSIVTLVDALNEVAGKNTWAYVRPNENILTTDGFGGLGPDAIATGFIYQRNLATPRGPATTFNIDALLDGDVDNNRWPLAQTFRIDGDDVTVIVNHFKSKGSSCTDTAGPGFGFGDDAFDPETGNCNLVRTYAAERLVEWADAGATRQQKNGKVLLVGDFNAYEEESPIETLVSAGYVDLVETLGDDAFTFKFSGRYGRLDYAFASPALVGDVSDAAVWQINSPAPVGYTYFNDWIDLSAHGSSDHDPVVVSLK